MKHTCTVQSLIYLRRRDVKFEYEDGSLIGRKCLYFMDLPDDSVDTAADDPDGR